MLDKRYLASLLTQERRMHMKFSLEEVISILMFLLALLTYIKLS